MHDCGVLILATTLTSKSPDLPLYGYSWCNETLKADVMLHKQVLKIKTQFEHCIGIPLYNQLSNLRRAMSEKIRPVQEELTEEIERDGGRLDSLGDILTKGGRELVSGTACSDDRTVSH
jgi:hypothetical protein